MRVLLFLLVSLTACWRGVRTQTREQNLEAGLEEVFSSVGERQWDFGDGTDRQLGREVRHAFVRTGRFVVRGFDGERLADQVEVFVVPRSAFHAVPSDADAALVARTLDELSPAVDFIERLAGPGVTERSLEALPVLGFGLDQGGQGPASLVDAAEGLGLFTWPDSDVVVGFVGVTVEREAREAFDGWLQKSGWQVVAQAEPRRYVRNTVYLMTFCDRGTLYAVSRTDAPPPLGAVGRVTTSDRRGLEANAGVKAELDALASGGLAFFSRPDPSAPWTAITASLKFDADQARVVGRLHGKGPLWSAPAAGPRLLEQVPGGAAVVASLSIAPDRLTSLLLGAPASARRRRFDAAAWHQGLDFEALGDSATGTVEGVAWFDAAEFLKGVVEHAGHPEPRGALRLEAGLRQSGPAEKLVEATLRSLGEQVQRAQLDGTTTWRTTALEQPVAVSLSPRALRIEAGAAAPPGPPEDLLKSLRERFGGAFGPGHVSVFLDVGQVRQQLLVPRQLEGLDPRSVLAAQAFTQAFLDQLTQLDQVMVDLAPDAQGAALQAVVKLRAKN